MDRIPVGNQEVANRIADAMRNLLEDMASRQHVIDNPEVFTRSGNVPANPVKSGAKFTNLPLNSTLTRESMAQAIKGQQARNIELAIMEANRILNTPTETFRSARPPLRPGYNPASLIQIMNPLAAILAEALTRHGALNTGEDEELAKRRQQPPTVDDAN